MTQHVLHVLWNTMSIEILYLPKTDFWLRPWYISTWTAYVRKNGHNKSAELCLLIYST